MALSDAQLISALEAAEAGSLGPRSSEIATDRADALDRYAGKPYGDEKAGRSQVISRDVSDVVEGVCANVLKPFVSGDRVVVFNPRGPEDEEAANQETDFINFVVLERNSGFLCLNSAIKDALLLRNGYLKLGWSKRDDITIESYQGLSEEELALLSQDEDVEVVGHSEYPAYGMPQVLGPDGAPMPPQPGAEPPLLHDIKVKRKRPTEYVEVMPAPPDEVLVSSRSVEPSVQHADFVQHQVRKTLSELREMGYQVDDDIADEESPDESIEDYARQLFEADLDDATNDPARRVVLFKEAWMRIDYNGDGIAELRRICRVGKTLLANEEADLIPIAVFTPVIMPHRHLGVSIYDLVKDIAEIKTAMLRSHLDNRYLQNNAEKVINVDAVENIDDFLISRPGGIKRVRGDPGGAVMPLMVPDTGSGALQTLEYLDSIRENRTGYTKAAEGMKSGSLATQTLGELQMQQSQSGIRLEMIARTIAETGLRDLFRLVHALTLKHSTKSEKVRLRNNWVAVNPREWVRRTDLSISVGLGTTAGPQQLQNLQMIGQAQQQAMPLGIVTPENIYNTLSKMATAAGFKNTAEFFTKPERTPKMGPDGQPVMGPDGQPEMVSAPPPPQKDPLVEAQEVKTKGELEKAQMDQQGEMQKAQMEMDSKPQEAQIEVQKAEMLARIEAETKITIAVETAKIEAQTKLQVAAIEAEIRDKECAMAHEREQMIGMERVKQSSRPAVQLGGDEANTAMAQAATHLQGQGEAMAQAIALMAQGLQGLTEAMSRPKKILRGPDGRAIGVQ